MADADSELFSMMDVTIHQVTEWFGKMLVDVSEVGQMLHRTGLPPDRGRDC